MIESIEMVIPGEEELGPQRQCLACGDWYPADKEFFERGRLQCRACTYTQRNQRRTGNAESA